MRLSKFYVKTLKETPKEAEVISHKLLLRSGMIKRLASGVYTYLPLGLKALKKVENIVREEQELKRYLCQYYNQQNFGKKVEDGM